MAILSIVAARILAPAEIGILGLAVIVVGLVSLLGAIFETAAVIGHSRARESDREYALVAAVERGVATACLLPVAIVALPKLVHLLVGTESGRTQLILLVHILLWQVVCEALATYPRVFLQRSLDLTFVALVALVGAGTSAGGSILLLCKGYGTAGMAYAAVTGAGLTMLLPWLRLLGTRHPRRRGIPSFSLWREVGVSSGKVFSAGFVGYLNGRIDNLLVAGALGPAALSFYGMAWNASRLLSGVAGQALRFVLVPTFAQIHRDREITERGIRESLRYSYLLLAPLCAVVFVAAPDLVDVVIGTKWRPLVPCLRVMCITSLAVPLIEVTNALLVGEGRPQMTGIATVAQLFVLLAAIPPLAMRWGVLGAAFGDYLATATVAVVLCVIVRRGGFRLSSLGCGVMVVPVIAAFSGGVAAWVAGMLVENSMIRVAVQASTVAVGYPLAVAVYGGKTHLREFALLLRALAPWRALTTAPT